VEEYIKKQVVVMVCQHKKEVCPDKEPVTKVSEGGINSYCSKCGKGIERCKAPEMK